jgi:predicted nucleic acid-binding protein
VQAFLAGYSGQLLTTRWVLMDVADGFASSRMRSEVRRLFEKMEGEVQITIIKPAESLYRRGLELYDARPDKEWSLTDCISFVVMADEGLTEALAGDGHFTKAGFKALLVKSRTVADRRRGGGLPEPLRHYPRASRALEPAGLRPGMKRPRSNFPRAQGWRMA